MRFRRFWLLSAGALAILGAVYGQRPFREFPEPIERFSVKPDWKEKTEWVYARLMYPPMPGVHGRGGGGFGRFRGSMDWRRGAPVGPPIIRGRTAISRRRCGA